MRGESGKRAPSMLSSKLSTSKNPRGTAYRLDDDGKGVAQTDTPGGTQKITIINESGLNSVIRQILGSANGGNRHW